MKEPSQLLITISRQIGSGGTYIGQKLAKILHIDYLDRDIIRQAAKELSVLEEEVASHDEKIPSFWQSFFQSAGCRCSDAYMPPMLYNPSDRDFFNAESEIIKRAAQEQSVVIIGRCGGYILREKPNHTSIFLHASVEFRKQRLQEMYHLTPEEAGKLVSQCDSERNRYHHTLTGKQWTDATQYNLSIDTEKLGLDNSVQLILKYIETV